MASKSKARPYNKTLSCHNTKGAANTEAKSKRNAGWTAKVEKNNSTGKWCIKSAGKRKKPGKKRGGRARKR